MVPAVTILCLSWLIWQSAVYALAISLLPHIQDPLQVQSQAAMARRVCKVYTESLARDHITICDGLHWIVSGHLIWMNPMESLHKQSEINYNFSSNCHETISKVSLGEVTSKDYNTLSGEVSPDWAQGDTSLKYQIPKDAAKEMLQRNLSSSSR